MIKKILSVALLLSLLIACSGDNKETKNKPEVTKKPLVKSGWLQSNLPENTLAYARVPNPWFFFSGQDNGFEYAQSNSAHNDQIESIKRGLFRNFIDSSSMTNKAILDLLLRYSNGPLEIAVLQERPGQIMPVIMLAAQFEFNSQQEFKEHFSNLLNVMPAKELAPMNSIGQGDLSIQGVSAHYQFDEASGRFSLFSGMFDMTTLKKVAQQIKPGLPSSMSTLQNQVDTSGQGLFVWMNGKELMPILEMSLNSQQLKLAEQFKLAEVNALALGYGTANAKSRIRVALDMPHVGIREYLPTVNNELAVKSVGEPSAFALLSLPTHNEIKKIISRVAEHDGEQQLVQLDRKVQETLGINFETLISILGPEITVFKDDVGSFAAVRLNDKATLNDLINKLKNSYGDYHIRKHNGTDIHHLSFRLINEPRLPNSRNLSASNFMNLLTQMSSHLFWIEKEGHLIFSSIPQPLMERIDKGAKTDIARWVLENQGQNIKHSLMAASGTFDDLSRNVYHTYIELMLMAAEIVDADMDIMELPTADKLGFAQVGTLGIQVDSTENLFAIEVTMEQGPLDLLHAVGSMQTVAVAGILAAVAIPAYQDYVERSKAYQKQIDALEEAQIDQSNQVYDQESLEEVVEIVEYPEELDSSGDQ